MLRDATSLPLFNTSTFVISVSQFQCRPAGARFRAKVAAIAEVAEVGEVELGMQTASKAPSGLYGPTINSNDIKALLIEEDSPEIANVEYVTSYNWLDGAPPTVLVPGKYPPCPSRSATDYPLTKDIAPQARHLLGPRRQRTHS
jgi:hypothetical protein